MPVRTLLDALGRLSFLAALVTGLLGMLFGAAGWDHGLRAVQTPFLVSILLTLCFGGKELDAPSRGRLRKRS